MPSVEEEIRACEARWIAVYLAKDAPAFAALLDDSFVYSSERGVFRKPEYVANLSSGEIEMRSFENTELHVVSHDAVAVSYGIAALQATFAGSDISGNDRFTRVWRREGADWKAIALHANAMEPPAEHD